jgi:hypothetical protein
VIILLLSIIQINSFDFSNYNNASASSTWTQTSESDFINGTIKDVIISQPGNLKLNSVTNYVEDNFFNESKILMKNDVVLDSKVGEIRLEINKTFTHSFSKTFGGGLSDDGYDIITTSDGGFIIIGATWSFGAGLADIWLIKTNSMGQMEWNKTYGSIMMERGRSVLETNDGGFVIMGITNSTGSGDFDIWLIKTNNLGIMEWNRTFGGVKREEGEMIVQTSDGGYIITGFTKSYGAGGIDPNGFPYNDIWLIKTNSTGHEQWNCTYGENYMHEMGKSIQQTSDGGYIIVGDIEEDHVMGMDEFYVWLLKTNSTGEEEWNQTFDRIEYDYGDEVLEYGDGGYIVLCQSYNITRDYDIWLIKTNQTGVMEWEKFYGGKDSENAISLKRTFDGGFIILSTVIPYKGGNGSEADSWLIKINETGSMQWNLSFGEIRMEWAQSIQQTDDGGFIVTGSMNSYGGGQQDVWLAKISINPGIFFNRSYGKSIDYHGWDVQQTSDNGYIFTGMKVNSIMGKTSVWLVKTDAYGEITWNRTFSEGDYNCSGAAVRQTNDGGYIVLSHSYSISTYNDIWLIKTNETGIEQWNKSIGGNHIDFCYSLQQTSDDGYIIVGQTMSNSAGGYDFYLVKTNSTGDPEWTRNFGGKGADMAREVIETSDGGFILIGDTTTYSIGGYDIWLIKTNDTGIEEWNRTFSGTDEEAGASIKQTSDGGFILAGRTRTHGPGNHDVWLIKTNDTGIEQWNRTFGLPGFGFNGIDFARSVDITSDLGYFIVGQTYSLGAGGYDIWAIKTNTTGIMEWNQTFGENKNDEGWAGQQTSDGGYIIIGAIKPQNSTDSQVHLIKIGNQGHQSNQGSMTSVDLLENINYLAINNLEYIANISNGTNIQVQYSQDCSKWYSSNCVINSKNDLKNGSKSIDLTSLKWHGSNFYYKLSFSSVNDFEPSIRYINFSYSQYNKSGSYKSPPFNIEGKVNLLNISWKAHEPSETELKFQIRTAKTSSALLSKQFVGPNGNSNTYYFVNGTPIWSGHGNDNSWIQYKAYFSSTNSSKSPILNEVTISYNLFPLKPSLISPLNNSVMNNNKPSFVWKFNDNDSKNQGAYQIQIADSPNFSNIYYDVMSQTNMVDHQPIESISDGIWYWRIRTKDIDGDWSIFSSYRKLIIDTEIQRPDNLMAPPDDWTNTNSFTVIWENPVDISGIAGAYYKLNIPPTSNSDGIYLSGNDTNSISGIAVDNDGNHLVYVWLKDIAGNVNYSKNSTANLYLDSTPPRRVKNLSVEPDTWSNSNSFNITWDNPTDLSGISGVFYKMDSEPTSNSNGIFVPEHEINSLKNFVVDDDGIHTIYLWLRDKAGNVNYLNDNSIKLYLDTTAPPPPRNIIANPNNWTSSNSFLVTWENPNDHSGIAGAFYKIGSLPTSKADGFYVERNEISSIDGLSVQSDGEQFIYIWLVDKVGNVNRNNYAEVNVYLDTTAPPPPEDVTVTPNYWTSINDFTINWSNPDDLSGVKPGAYYSFGASTPTKYSHSTWTKEKPFKIDNAPKGEYKLYLWLEDNLGNSNYQNYNSVPIKLDQSPPEIIDLSYWSNLGYMDDLGLEIEVIDRLSGVDEVLLFYKKKIDTNYISLEMNITSYYNNGFEANIPYEIISDFDIEFYIKAIDNSTPPNIIYFGINGETLKEPDPTTDIDFNKSTPYKEFPYISSYGPTGQSEPVITQINVGFSKNMNKASVYDAFSISPNISGNFSWEGNILVFTPDENLRYNREYTVVVTNFAKDLGGYHLIYGESWSFKIEPEPEINKPGKKDEDEVGSQFQGIAVGVFIIILVIIALFLFMMLLKKRKDDELPDKEEMVEPKNWPQTELDYSNNGDAKNYNCPVCGAVIMYQNQCRSCGWPNQRENPQKIVSFTVLKK